MAFRTKFENYTYSRLADLSWLQVLNLIGIFHLKNKGMPLTADALKISNILGPPPPPPLVIPGVPLPEDVNFGTPPPPLDLHFSKE